MSLSLSRKLLGLVRVSAGIPAIGALFYFSRIDLKALTVLANGPAAIICIVLVFSTIPVAALRWAILLRILGFDIAFGKLYHVTAIANFLNAFFIGPLGGDLTRTIYVWRIIGRGGAGIASSIVADRLLGLFAAFCIALLYVIFNWPRMSGHSALFTLAISIILGFSGLVVGAATVLIAPALIKRCQKQLLRWPRIDQLFGWVHDTVCTIRRRPIALLQALALALLSQAITVCAVMVVGRALGGDTPGLADYMLAVPVTLVANTLPITPNGLGIGEAAFDQVCRWLVNPVRDVAYSNIFFAFRILGLVASLSGLISLFLYRNSAEAEPAEAGSFTTRSS
jgi:uncharacterized protein (TIRG00374 family)